MIKSLNKTSLRTLLIFIFSLAIVLPLPVFATAGGDTISSFLYGFFITIGGIILWLGGVVLDFSVNVLVVGMGEQINNQGIGVVINSSWALIRDIFNIVFIFAIILIGFRIILKSDNSSAKRSLGLLIVAALLINFSLLVSKVIIDGANIAAIQIYNQITVTARDGGTSVFNFNNLTEKSSADLAFQQDHTQKSISGAFMQQIRLTSYADGSVLQKLRIDGDWIQWRFVMFGFVMMLFMMITGVVFFAGGIMLIGRFVKLVLFMVFSPLMLAGYILPQLQPFMDKWWRQFLSAAFIAPAFMFMIHLSLSVLRILGGTQGSFADAFNTAQDHDSLAIIGNFILMSGFMIASLVVAQKMGGVGAGTALGVLKMAKNNAQGFVGRNTIGRTAGLLQTANNSMERSRTGRNFKRGLSTLSFGTFTERDRVQALEAGVNQKFGGRISRKDDKEWSQKDGGRDQRRESLQDEVAKARAKQNKEELDDKSKADREAYLADIDNVSSSTTKLDTAMNELGRNIKDMSGKDKSSLKLEVLTREEVAINLNDDDIKALEESGKFTLEEVGKIKEARKSGFKNIAKNGSAANSNRPPYAGLGDTRRASLMSRPDRELGKLPPEVFAETGMAPYLTPSAVTERMRNGLSEKERNEIQKNVNDYLSKSSTPEKKKAPWRKWSNSNSVYAGQLGLDPI